MTITLQTLAIGITLSLSCLIGVTSNSAVATEKAAPKDTVRPAVGKPLQAAQELTTTRQYKAALEKIDEAEAVTEKTPYENYMIARTRGATAFADGQTGLSAKSFATAIASDRLTVAELLEITKALAMQFYSNLDYPNAIIWASRYLEKGGADPQIKILMAQSHYLHNDYANAANLLQELIRANESAGLVTPEPQLQLWANCELKLKRNSGFVAVMEILVSHYPKKEYWNDLIRRIQRLPKFSERLTLDAYRLLLYAGSLENAEEVTEMAALAMQAGFPVEAMQVIDRGYADKLLGIGADAAKHKKIQDQANNGVAEDLKALAQDEQRALKAKTAITSVNTGFNFVLHGQFEKGIALIEHGIAMGGLRFPEDAKLKLAMAYVYSGQKLNAVQVFKTITGADGTADLARLWMILIG